MTRSHFITADEALQIYCRNEHGAFIAESDYLNKTYATIQDVLNSNKLDDTVIRITRLDLDTLTNEDITEDLAEAYYNAIPAHQQPYSWEADTLPPFVSESLFWEVLCDDESIPRSDYVEHCTHRVVSGRVA